MTNGIYESISQIKWIDGEFSRQRDYLTDNKKYKKLGNES